MKVFHSLRARLLIAMTSIFALGVLAALVSYHLEVNGVVRDIHDRTLQTQASDILGAIGDHPPGTVTRRLAEDWQKAYSDPSRQYSFTLYDASGRVLASAPNLSAPLANVLSAPSQTTTPIQFVGVGNNQRAVLAMRDKEGRIAVVARGDLSHDALADSLFQEEAEQVFILAPFALLALIVIWFISGWSLRPLARASAEAALVGPANPEMRLSTDGLPEEIGPLVDAVNGAVDRLAQAYATEKRLTVDAAHELRTPLSVLNLRLQRARASGTLDWSIIERELGQMNRVIAQLLSLARKETLAREAYRDDFLIVNLSKIIREASASIVPLAESQKRRIRVELPDAAHVNGRTDDLRDLFRNLLENAIVHGLGTVSIVILPAHLTKPRWHIEVCDEGDGVEAGKEQVIFERFRKLHPASPGAGLGLAIVREVATQHGGDVQFTPRRGRVTVDLPMAETPPVKHYVKAQPHENSHRSP